MTEFDFGNGPVPAHQHPNGGGWVADTATVADTAYVGRDARVFDSAWVSNARVFDSAWVFGNARVFNALVSGYARVTDYARVCNARVSGYAWVSGNAIVNKYVSGEEKIVE